MVEGFCYIPPALGQFLTDFEALEGFTALPGTYEAIRLRHGVLSGNMVPCFCPITAVVYTKTNLHFAVTQADTAGLKIGLARQDSSYIIAAADEKRPEILYPDKAELLLHLRSRMLAKLKQLTPTGDPQ